MSISCLTPYKLLATKQAIWWTPLWVGERHVRVSQGLVKSGRGKARRTFQHPMVYARWLQDGVSLLEPERWSLSLIDDLHPSVMAVDELKVDLVVVVVVDPILHRTAMVFPSCQTS